MVNSTEHFPPVILNSSSPVSTMSTLKRSASEKDGVCRKLKQQLDALENETAAKLADMDQYQNDIQVRTFNILGQLDVQHPRHGEY